MKRILPVFDAKEGWHLTHPVCGNDWVDLPCCLLIGFDFFLSQANPQGVAPFGNLNAQ